MPHVSKRKIKPKLLGKLLEKFLAVFEKAHSRKFAKEVMQELFTKTEKIMLAKRLAIILMLQSETPQDKIADVLKVSPTTVARMSLNLEIGKYDTILQVSEKEKTDILKIVEDILLLWGFMPPKYGKKYWKKSSKK